MKFAIVACVAFTVRESTAWDFSGLLGKIQSETLKFDRMADTYKNKEEAGIRSVQLHERDIDRSLEALKQRLHLDGTSFLERHRKHKHRSHKPVKANAVTFSSDEKELEDLEHKREAAERTFLETEKEIAGMPERIFHSKEKQAKENFEVPLIDEDNTEE